jgi:CubicO group peptidase (beta-lactamase class C family)
MFSPPYLAIYLWCTLLNLNAQVPANGLVELVLKKKISAALKAGQVDQYSISLKQRQFAAIRIQQETVGIGYRVFAPGDSLLEYTDLNALYQSETITIEAKKTGHYRVEVFWDYGRPQSGQYSILWDKVQVSGKTEVAKAEQLFQSWYEANGPGAAVMVIKDQKVIYKSAKGMANLEHNIPLSQSSVFDLASVSKQFTGFAIAMLADKGQLSLDDSIRKFIPGLPYFGKTITVRHLLDHTSGLRNWDDMMNASGYKREDVITMDMILKMASTVRYLNFTPGEYFSYCNTGYNLLAIIVERVTGQSFGGWMKDNVFGPLGMNSTMIREGIETIIPNKAYCYKAFKEGYNLVPDNIAAPGSSSVCSSIDDLLKWINNFETGQVGGRNVTALIKTKDTLNNGKSLDYAFGNFIGQYKGIDRIEHLGLLAGFRTSIARFPGEKLAVVYLSNDGNDATYHRALTIAGIFLKGIKRDSLKLRPLPDIKDYLVKTGPLVPGKDTSDLSGYEGTYFARELNVSFTLKAIDSILMIMLPRTDTIYLKQEKPDEFSTTFPDFTRRVVFRRDENKKLTGFFLTTGGRGILFTKMGN